MNETVHKKETQPTRLLCPLTLRPPTGFSVLNMFQMRQQTLITLLFLFQGQKIKSVCLLSETNLHKQKYTQAIF